MRPILLANSPDKLELNALFIQPTNYCANNCKGCYVKSYLNADFQTPQSEHARLFDWFYYGRKGCWANQITISIDRLPKPIITDERGHMLHWFFYPISRLMIERRTERPEVHMTFHCLSDFREYVNVWRRKTDHRCAQALDMMSLSKISDNELEDIRVLIAEGANINYNHMIDNKVTSRNIDKYVDHITKVGKVVNSIYLIIFKEPMGRKLPMGNRIPAEVQLRRKSRLAHDLAAINTLRERLPKDVWRKVRVDGCLQDSAKYLRTDHTCSSNVSRFQVWPDGSVTGCPYALHSAGPLGWTADDIVANIRRTRGKNEFRQGCYIPKVLDSLPRRSKGN